eukprot:g6609.t1
MPSSPGPEMLEPGPAFKPPNLVGKPTSGATTVGIPLGAGPTPSPPEGQQLAQDSGALPAGQPTTSETTVPDGSSHPQSNRPQWKRRGDFLMVLMGYAIGIGNLWRFPFLCGKYGGGAFVVVYLVCLVFCAFPLFFLELVLGQVYQTGPVQCFRALHSRFEGVAYIAAWMNVWILSYYQIVICWALVYFARSFGWFSKVPWHNHDPREYFERDVLDRASSFDATRAYNWHARAHLLLSITGVWLITYLCLVKGIHSAGKVAYFTVIAPFVLIFILLVKTTSLPGAGDGIAYYLKPNLDYLFRLETWSVACGQILFSLSPATGAAVALASYNPVGYKHLLSDAITIAITNSGFSILSGFVVFSVVGNLAHTESKPVHEVAQEGAGLTFVVFPQALASMPTVFSWFFFLTLVLLGLDSSLAWVQTLVTYAMDSGILLGRRSDGRLGLLSTTLVYTCRNGVYILETVDHFAPTYCLLFSAFLEFVLFGYVVGVERTHCLIVDACCRVTGSSDGGAPPDGGATEIASRSPRLERWLRNNRRLLHVCLRYVGPILTGGLLFALFVTDVFFREPQGLLLELLGWSTVLVPILGFFVHAYRNELQALLGWDGSSCGPVVGAEAVAVAGFTKASRGPVGPESSRNEAPQFATSAGFMSHADSAESNKV